MIRSTALIALLAAPLFADGMIGVPIPPEPVEAAQPVQVKAPPRAAAPSAPHRQYFRLAGPNNWHVYDGALFTTKGLGFTQNTTVLALVTHSTADGSVLPASWVAAGFAEAWTPFVLGGSEGGGSADINFGPLFNFGPHLQAIIRDALAYAPAGSFQNFRTLLSKTPGPGPDVTFSLGVILNAAAVRGGHFQPVGRWFLDPVRYFAGPALHF